MNGADFNQMEQLKQIEEMKKNILTKILTKEAYERLGRIRIANPQFASQVELYLLQVYQTGKIENRITDEKLKDLLKILSEKKEFKIKRK